MSYDKADIDGNPTARAAAAELMGAVSANEGLRAAMGGGLNLGGNAVNIAGMFENLGIQQAAVAQNQGQDVGRG